jgi:hypothetical protein
MKQTSQIMAFLVLITERMWAVTPAMKYQQNLRWDLRIRFGNIENVCHLL